MSDIITLLKRQREFYQEGKTKEIRYRLFYLKKLEQAIRRHEEDIMEALRKDLNKAAFEAYATEIGIVLEDKGVVLVYASMYGNTENVMNVLANKLALRGIRDMKMYDVSKTHASYIISDLWKYSHMVIGSPTYNMHLYFVMDALLKDISVLGLKNRKVSIIGNHSWASAAMKSMKEQLEAMNGMEIIGAPMDVRSSLKSEQEPDLDALADAIYESWSWQ
jgi:flavorubredoxin